MTLSPDDNSTPDGVPILGAMLEARGTGMSIIPIDHKTSILDAMLAARRAKLSIIPINDLNKRPKTPKQSWSEHQKNIAAIYKVRRWAQSCYAFAVVCGKVSGGLLVLDFDVAGFYPAWRKAVGSLADDLPVQQTGGGGHHVFIRTDDPGKNKKLAWSFESGKRWAAIETRAEGGYVVVPPSLHPSGERYKWINGDLTSIKGVSQEDANALLKAARGLDETPKKGRGHKAAVPSPPAQEHDGGRLNGSPDERALLVDRCKAYMEKCPKAISGEGGHDATFRAACECFKFGLSEAEARTVLEWFNDTKTGTSDPNHRARWTDVELEHKLTDALKAVTAAGKIGIRNNKAKGPPKLTQASKKELSKQQKLNQSAVKGDAGHAAPNKQKRSQADLLVALAQENGVELFHTPGGHDSEPYATIAAGEHKANFHTHTKPFRRYLAKLYFDTYGKTPGSQAIQDALPVLAGNAVHEGAEHEVHVRIAGKNGIIYLDLANADHQVVEVMSTGWRVIAGKHVPVKFIGKRGMLALPAPISGGSVDDLHPLVNLPNEDDWILLKTWLVAAFRPSGPYPPLVMNAEAGSGKSFLTRFCRALIDPNKAALRAEPRDGRDLMIAATNSWVIALDNMSHLASWLSDAICRLATGGGFATRELYSDGDEKLFEATRPVMLNGIDDLCTRGDLLDRAIVMSLPPIPDGHRRTEADLIAEFESRRPGIMGALMDAVVVGLRDAPTTKLKAMPRMADFATFATAAAPSLAVTADQFLAAYSGNRENADALAVEASLIGDHIDALVNAEGAKWEGRATDLLKAIDGIADEQVTRRHAWPTTPQAMANALRRITSNLRAIGIDVSFEGPKGKGKSRNICLKRTGNPSEQECTIESAGAAGAANPPSDLDTPKTGGPNHHEAESIESAADPLSPPQIAPDNPESVVAAHTVQAESISHTHSDLTLGDTRLPVLPPGDSGPDGPVTKSAADRNPTPQPRPKSSVIQEAEI